MSDFLDYACIHGNDHTTCETCWSPTVGFYVCPNHCATGGYEDCCNCGGWDENDPDHGRLCTEATG